MQQLAVMSTLYSKDMHSNGKPLQIRKKPTELLLLTKEHSMAASKEQNSLLQTSKPFLQAQKIKQKKSDSIFGKYQEIGSDFFILF